ncbi:MAG: DedA family protein [Acaryochloridaceae cyanobacterium RU_4_10]|nr:DedA family protein [Acaryochloridaceae cyanobacterium RU_4_10]
MHFDLQSLIRTAGYLGVWAIIFAESGLLIGFFLPGDSLLFVAGFIASTPNSPFNIVILTVGCWIAAVAGDNVGYSTGYRFGRKLFRREESWFFHKENLVKAQNFYAKHGKKTIILARFLPIVRTFAPIVAGIGSMNYRVFFIYNVVGGTLWAIGLTLLGYFLGRWIPSDLMEKYLILIIVMIVITSLLPSVWHLYQERKYPQK